MFDPGSYPYRLVQEFPLLLNLEFHLHNTRGQRNPPRPSHHGQINPLEGKNDIGHFNPPPYIILVVHIHK